MKNLNTDISNDERLEALLILAEQQAGHAKEQGDIVGELVATLETVTAQLLKSETDKTDNFNERAKRAIERIESLAERVVTENTLTKTELVNVIANTVNSYFVRNLATNLSNEVKANIQNAIGNVVGDLISKAVQTDVSDLRSEIRAIREELRATANETKQIAQNINHRLKEGADEIVGAGVTQILDGVQEATASYQNTVTQLERVAKVTENKSRKVTGMLDDINATIKGNHYWFLGAFCFGFAVFCIMFCAIFWSIKVPSDSEIASQKKYLTQLQQEQQRIFQVRKYQQTQLKDGRVYIRVNTSECLKDDYCRMRSYTDN